MRRRFPRRPPSARAADSFRPDKLIQLTREDREDRENGADAYDYAVHCTSSPWFHLANGNECTSIYPPLDL